nr:tyrosine-type recombinase/integrase [Sinorhizobium fredii]
MRDRALLLAAFASGGRRRSEVAALHVEELTDEEPVRADPSDKDSPPLPCLSIRLGRTKTTAADDDEHVLLIGRPVEAMAAGGANQRRARFPAHRPVGNVDRRSLTPQSVNLILKARAKQAGLDPALFSAHGLRSGYLTEAANRGIPLPEVAAQVGDPGGELTTTRNARMDERPG